MKNNKVYIIIILSLFAFSLFVSNQYIDLRNASTHSSTKSPCDDLGENKNRMISNMELDNKNMKDDMQVISISNNTLLTIKDIIHPDTMYLILKYPLSYSSDCIHTILDNMEKHQDSIPCIRFIVLANRGTTREMKVKLLPYIDKFPMYHFLHFSLFGFDDGFSNLPYISFVDGKTSKHTLILGSNSTELLHDYIQMLSKKYCE